MHVNQVSTFLYRLVILGLMGAFLVNLLIHILIIIQRWFLFPNLDSSFLSEFDSLLFSSSITFLTTLSLILGFLYVHDQRILRLRQKTGRRTSLDRDGLQVLNRDFNIETSIIHEDDPFGDWKIYTQDFPEHVLEELHSQFLQAQKEVEENTEGTPKSSEMYLEIRTLPHLPSLLERDQVGLFTKKKVPKWSLFYWTGDLGVAWSDSALDLPTDAHMNRRTLISLDGVDFFQGGSQIQRSSCAVLANFFWCNTSTTPHLKSPYYLLPPHFLGVPNCVYVTTKKDGQVCSALLAFKEIKKDEQILMFTGFSSQSKIIDRHLKLYSAIPWVAFLAMLITLKQLYICYLIIGR